jgi:hypothetical protein
VKLAYKLDSLDGLDEALKPLYAKDGDKFVLQVDDSGASSAVRKERERAEAAERALKDREKADLEQKTAKEREELERKGEYEKLRAKDEAELASLRKQLQDTNTAHETHLKETKALTLLGPLAATPKTLESLKREFMDQLEIVQGQVLVKGDPSLTPEKLAEKFKANPDYAPFLKGTNANGGGAGNPGRVSTDTPRDQMTGVQLIKAGLDAGELNP